MAQCPACRISYVANTVFCTECGLYLLESEEITTDPLESATSSWDPVAAGKTRAPNTDLLTIRLRIRTAKSSKTPATSHSPFHVARSLPATRVWATEESYQVENTRKARDLEVPLTKPIRLGRVDPREGVYPDVDLTADLAMEHGVSREHICIFQRGDVVEVEDLASTNGTKLNGKRLAPYLPAPLKHGDRLQLGKLLIEVRFGANQRRTTTTQTRLAVATAH